MENESSDFEDACDIATSSSPERIFSSSLSSLEGERTRVDDSDNDSGFVGVSQGSLDRLDTATPDVNNETNGFRLAEQGTNGVYDREAILREIANSSSIGEARIVLNIERMKRGSSTTMSTDSARSSEDENLDADKSAEEGEKPMLERLRDALEAVPDSMLHLMTGRNRPGDCGRPSDQKPDWLDMDKLRRGQKFAQDHMFPVYFAEMLALFALFSFEDGLKPLIVTGKSSTPYTAFKRYLSTGMRVRHWYTGDLWEKGTVARKDILTVRAMHAAVKRRLDASTNEEIDLASTISNPWCPTREMLIKDFSETCAAPAIGQCPYTIVRNSPDRPKGINQLEMALTQWGFIGLITSYPKLLGVHDASDEDLEAFCHLWRSIGYQLGMEDEYNFCRGSLADIRQRSHDFLEAWVKPNLREITPEWEHMMRCVISGVASFLPGITYESALFYLSEILELQMPRLYASLSYAEWINHNLSKSLFYYTIRLPGMSRLFNTLLNRALDRAEKLTPEQYEAIRIKLSEHPVIEPENNKNSISTNS